MRNIWNIMSFLAVVHVMAALMFLGWLWQSGRLSAERVQSARELFAVSEADAAAAAAKAQAEAEQAQQRELDEQRAANPPIDSARQVQLIGLLQEQEAQARRRLMAERSVILQQLSQLGEQMNEQQTTLQRQIQEHEALSSGERSRRNDEQFAQTVRQLEQLPPKQAKRVLVELVNQNRMDQAVSYLNAMNARATSKVLREFKTEAEIALATELLEKLRTFGNEPMRSAGATGATVPPSASANAQGASHAAGDSATSP